MRIFLGITGASGAPYAARLVDALVDADAELGICISRAGYEVLATELYRDVSLPQDEIAQRLTGGAEGVTIYGERDWNAPYASGSAKVDAYVVCPCSMGTLGTIASGAMSNLIHRAASVALKEGRKLILCPRETPLSRIHLRNMLEAQEAGATILFLAPGFYHGASKSDAPAEPGHPHGGVASERLSVDELVDFVVSRLLDQLGIEHEAARWGQT